MINDNPRNFFNWQGNNLSFTYIGNYITTGIIILSLVLGIIFKHQINNYFIKKEQQKIFIWKNMDSFLQTVGIIMVFIWSFKIFILIFYNYPIYYEHIPLHLCRFHFVLISLFFIFRKKELIRHILYLSFLSSIIAVLFGTTKNDLSGSDNIFIEKGFTYYDAGFDTHFYLDFHITHLLTGVLPVIITIGINKKITTIQFYRIIIFYYFLGVLMFGLNFMTDFANEKGWRSNYWYLGRDRNNEMKDFLGLLTKWPQNLFFYLNVGILYVYICHFVFMSIHGSFKKNLKQFIKEHNMKIFKRIFQLKNI